ncbi:hypothetical protein [Geodermatophilus sp. URMC 62]|uniref:hypothetical protein n=1 Tax=Geodermatophilus sp. URMC 62 TaxID=3423414 RepID=UPI00406C6D8C
MFRTQSRSEVIEAELQESLSHLGIAVTEAGRAAAEQLAPRVEAARDAAGPVLESAREVVAPKVAAAVAVAAPAVEAAREALTPRVEAAWDAAGPVLDLARDRVDAAVEVLTPRLEAAREAAGPALTAALATAGAAAARTAADLAPHVTAVQVATRRALADEVAPRVLAAREAVGPALDDARGSLAAGVGTALIQLGRRRAELAAGTAKATADVREMVVRQQARLGREAARTTRTVRRRAHVQPEPRRWPWLVAIVAALAAATVLMRRKREDPWTPAPAGDGPVPSYREDPVPSSPSNDQSGKTVSDAQFVAGDSAPAESDMGIRDAQNVAGDAGAGETDPTQTAPEPFTSGGNAQEGPTAGPAAGQA